MATSSTAAKQVRAGKAQESKRAGRAGQSASRASARAAAPRKAASGKAAPRKAASGKAAPRKKAASGKAAPRKAAPRKTAASGNTASRATRARGKASTGSATSPAALPPHPAISPRPGSTGLVFDGIDRWLTLVLGIGEFVTSYSQETLGNTENRNLGRQLDGADDDATEGPSAADLLSVLPGAGVVLMLRVQRGIFDAVAGAEKLVSDQITRFGAVRLSSPMLRRVHGFLAGLDEQFKAEQRQRATLAADFLAAAGPETLDALLARIDLEAVLHRVDLDAVVERVDLDQVLQRVDLDEVVSRVDVDQVVSKVDVNELMSGVIGELEVAGLLRDSTGAIANSTVGVLRNQVGGVANRITRRPVS